MTISRTEPRLGSLFCGFVASVMFLLLVSLVLLTAKGPASGSESSPVSFGKSDRHGAVELPGGIDPMAVVRMVERNREEVSLDASGVGSPRAVEGLGPPFHIGGAPVYGPTANAQYLPAVAFDGTNYLVVWMDYRSESPDIYGARVSAGGTVLDTSGIAISAALGEEGYPAVAFDGTNYLVVWTDSRSQSPDIYGARVSVGGSVLDASGIAISTAVDGQYLPAVAFDGTNYLVVWTDYRSGSPDIYGARVSVGGTLLDTSGIAISTALSDVGYPAVAFDNANYLVVWHDARGEGFDIYGARVSMGGVVLDASGIAISTALGDESHPAVTFDGTNCLVVWTDSRSVSLNIYGARVSAGGTVLDTSGIAISTAANRQYYPAVAFDGTNCLVVWIDYRSESPDIYGARVSAGGTVLDTSGIAISTAANDQLWPALGRGPTCQLLIVYQSFMPPPEYGSYRIWGHIWRGPRG